LAGSEGAVSVHAQRILVIDDEPQICRVVRNALEQDVDRVLEARTGKAGIDSAAAERPEWIVLDLGLLPAFTVHALRGGVEVFDRGGVRGALAVAVDDLTNELYAESSNTSFFRPQPCRSVIASWVMGF
jgi:hypothetical protein